MIVRNGSADLGNNGGAGGSWTVSYSVNSASDLVVFFITGSNSSAGTVQTISGATYGGQTLINAGAVPCNATFIRCCTLFYLFNPPTGANNLVVSQSGGGLDTYLIGVAADYGGCTTSGLDGAVNTYTSGGTAETSQSAPSGSIANSGAWVISGCGPNTTTTLTNTALTEVVAGAAFTLGFIFDSNGSVGATGAFANTYNFDSIPFSAIVMAVDQALPVFSDSGGVLEPSLRARSANERQRTVWWS